MMMYSFNITRILFFINLLLVLAKDDHVHLQRRAITPLQPSGGNGNNHGGTTPVPSLSDRILNPVNNRGIRIREPVDRHPELPSNHPNTPYSTAIRPPRHSTSKEDKGKEKMKENEQQLPRKKRKADEMTHDREASTSKVNAPAPAPTPPTSSPPYRRRRYRYRTREQRKKEDEDLVKGLVFIIGGTAKVVNDTYQAGKKAYRKVKDTCDAACQKAKDVCNAACQKAKDTCDAACQKAKQNVKQIRLGVLGRKRRIRPLERYRPPSRADSNDSSKVAIVKKNGELRQFTVRQYHRTKLVHPDTYQQTVPNYHRLPSPPLYSSSSGEYTSSWTDPVPDHSTSSSEIPRIERNPSASSGISSVNDQRSRLKGKRPRSSSTTSDASSSSTKSPPLKKRLRSSKKS